MDRKTTCKYCGTEYTYQTYSEEIGEVERHEECPNCHYFYDFAYSDPITNQPIYEELKKYRDTGLTPEEIIYLKSERDQLVDRCGGTIPVHCVDCELWGSNGWSQQGVGYCEGDDKPHGATDFCSYGEIKVETLKNGEHYFKKDGGKK